MKKLFAPVILAGIFALTLAACGGGGSTGGVTPVVNPSPTVKPSPTNAPVTHQVLFSWTGAMAPPSARTPQFVSMDSGATPAPVMAGECDAQVESCTDNPSLGWVLSDDVQPLVTAVETNANPEPQATFISSSPNLPVGTPRPQPSASAPPLPVPVGPAATPGSYSVTAQFPDGTQASKTVNYYPRFHLGCGYDRNAQPYQPGFNFDTGSYESDMATSDIYITGPLCAGAFNDPSGVTIHVPGGFVALALNDSENFSTLTPSQLTNPQTTVSGDTFATGAANGIQLFILKTRAGNVVKFDLDESATGNQGGNVFIAGVYLVTNGPSFAY